MANPRAESGQVLVETAIVLPIMFFMILGGVQLMGMQFAKVMVEYAAFNACRAGIVHNGDPNVMRNAALISLLPAFGPTGDAGELAMTWGKVKIWAEITEAIDSGVASLEKFVTEELHLPITGLFPDVSIVDVEIMEPTRADFALDTLFDEQQGTLQGELRELQFDVGDDRLERAVLAIRVRYLYRLRVPVADRLIFEIWMAAHALKERLTGNLFDPRLESGQRLRDRLGQAGSVVGGGESPQESMELEALQALSNMERPVFFIPIYASYAMPMQSAFYKKYVEH